ncbi:MAG: methyltransferase domain-containing protein [Gemmatimonas sp.]|nr:methyltransferase domain-containing protein [Gemmatimonas sp.]
MQQMSPVVGAPPSLFDRMAALTDPFRARVSLVLERHELTVTELCSVFQVPQSTMSRHLKALLDEGWIAYRAEGTSRRYRMLSDQLPAEVGRLWKLVRAEVVRMSSADRDLERVRSVLAERRSRSQEYFSTVAGEWDRLRLELIGRRLDLMALLGLVDDGWVVGDLGCGTGQVSKVLAPFVGEVIAVDDSSAMLAAARERLVGHSNVDVRSGDLEKLPIEDGRLDVAVLFFVLHYMAEPVAVLREAARVLRPGGRLLIVDLAPHDREEYRLAMGHLWLGFDTVDILGWMEEAGLKRGRYVTLPADPEAKGPTIFAATGGVPREGARVPGPVDRGRLDRIG